MKIIDRLLKIGLPPAQSAFLWGPRKTGKTTYQKKNSRKAWYMIFSKQTCLLSHDHLLCAEEPIILHIQITSSAPLKPVLIVSE